MSLEAATSEIYFANTSRREDVHILCPAQRQAPESVHTICQDTLLVSVRSHRTHSEMLPASAEGLADTGTSAFHKQPPCILFPLYRLENRGSGRRTVLAQDHAAGKWQSSGLHPGWWREEGVGGRGGKWQSGHNGSINVSQRAPSSAKTLARLFH